MRLLFTLLVLLAFGCQKETIEPGPCSLEGYGTIRVNNDSPDKYQVEIGALGITAVVDAGGWTEIKEVPANYYRVDFYSLDSGGGGFLNIQVTECATSLVPIL